MDDGYGEEEEEEEGSHEPGLESMEGLEQLLSNPNFEMIRQRLITDPNFQTEFMAMLQEQMPTAYQTISQNPEVFMRLITHGMAGEGGEGEESEEAQEGEEVVYLS
jgi:hypothetical protein